MLPECRAALATASAQALTRARSRSSSSASPTTTASTLTWCCRSMRPAMASIASRSRAPASVRRAPIQPGAQLALLGARQARHLARRLAALDERQRLEHRVVEVRRHLGARLGPDAAAALLDQLAAHAPDPRAGDQGGSADGHDHRQQHVAGRRAATCWQPGRRPCRRGSAASRSPAAAARPARVTTESSGVPRLEQRPAPAVASGSRPQDGEADGGQHDRPARARPRTRGRRRAGGSRRPTGIRPTPTTWPPRRRADPSRGRGSRRLRRCLQGRQEPGQQVHDEPEAERRRRGRRRRPAPCSARRPGGARCRRPRRRSAVGPAALEPRARAGRDSRSAPGLTCAMAGMFPHARRASTIGDDPE